MREIPREIHKISNVTSRFIGQLFRILDLWDFLIFLVNNLLKKLVKIN